MVGSKRGVRGTERQLHRSAVNVGNKVTGGIALNDATNISDVMSKARQNEIGVVARGRQPLQVTPDQDVMADKRDQHRVFDVMIQRIAVADAFQRKLGRERQQFGELGMGRAKPAARFRRQERTQRLRHHFGDRNQRQWPPDLALAPRVDLAVGAILCWPMPILLQATVFPLDLSQASPTSGAHSFARFDSGDTSLPFPPCRETHVK